MLLRFIALGAVRWQRTIQRSRELLIAFGAVVNARTSTQSTPLYWAVRRGCKDITQLLLQHGADPTLRDHMHRAVFDVAERMGHTAISAILQSHKHQQTGRGVTPETSPTTTEPLGQRLA